MFWIYTTVWWPRVVCKVSRMELCKLQRLAYQRGDDDGPTAAMEVLLGLSSLRVMIEAETQGLTK